MSIDLTVDAYCSLMIKNVCICVIFYGSYDDQGEVQIRSDSWYIEWKKKSDYSIINVAVADAVLHLKNR